MSHYVSSNDINSETPILCLSKIKNIADRPELNGYSKRYLGWGLGMPNRVNWMPSVHDMVPLMIMIGGAMPRASESYIKNCMRY